MKCFVENFANIIKHVQIRKEFQKICKILRNFSEISEIDSLKNSIKRRFNNSFPALIRAEIPATGAGERGLHPGALAIGICESNLTVALTLCSAAPGRAPYELRLCKVMRTFTKRQHFVSLCEFQFLFQFFFHFISFRKFSVFGWGTASRFS